MRIETFPLIIGVIVALLGVSIIFDAWTPDSTNVAQERRRRPRIERHRTGEALIGFGVLALAAAFIGRDSWRYSVLVVLLGAAFLVIGTALNARYVRALFVNRGPLRRREEGAEDFAHEQHPAAPVQAQPQAVADVEKPIPTSRPEPPRREPSRPSRKDGGWDGPERRRSPRG